MVARSITSALPPIIVPSLGVLNPHVIIITITSAFPPLLNPSLGVLNAIIITINVIFIVIVITSKVFNIINVYYHYPHCNAFNKCLLVPSPLPSPLS